MKLLVGLGNPGERYARNRHNIGFMAVDAIARRHGFGPWRSRFQGSGAEGLLGPEKSVLLKPSTYMNESGRAVGEALRFYKASLDDLIVFHDEIDLAAGKLRVKRGGGNAGHNGLRSISAHVGNEYVRVRIGVGHPGVRELVHAHVLSDFGKEEVAWVNVLCAAVADNAALLAAGNEATFQNKVHLALGPEVSGTREVSNPS